MHTLIQRQHTMRCNVLRVFVASLGQPVPVPEPKEATFAAPGLVRVLTREDGRRPDDAMVRASLCPRCLQLLSLSPPNPSDIRHDAEDADAPKARHERL
jgi:hypothetical protein